MPLYTVVTQDGFLSAEQRDVIAAELVRIHTAAMNVPADFVHSIFPTYPRNQTSLQITRPSPLFWGSYAGAYVRRKDPARLSPLENVPGQHRDFR